MQRMKRYRANAGRCGYFNLAFHLATIPWAKGTVRVLHSLFSLKIPVTFKYPSQNLKRMDFLHIYMHHSLWWQTAKNISISLAGSVNKLKSQVAITFDSESFHFCHPDDPELVSNSNYFSRTLPTRKILQLIFDFTINLFNKCHQSYQINFNEDWKFKRNFTHNCLISK